jgi:uncharacterized protein (TIGR00369 family)
VATRAEELIRQVCREPVGLDRTLGIRYEKVEADEVIALLDVGPTHHQPLGYLHGGVSVALAESVASIGGTLSARDGSAAFGMEINANHLRPFREGTLKAVGRPLHRGKTTQVWEVRITDNAGKLVCVARCTLAVVEAV